MKTMIEPPGPSPLSIAGIPVPEYFDVRDEFEGERRVSYEHASVGDLLDHFTNDEHNATVAEQKLICEALHRADGNLNVKLASVADRTP